MKHILFQRDCGNFQTQSNQMAEISVVDVDPMLLSEEEMVDNSVTDHNKLSDYSL